MNNLETLCKKTLCEKKESFHHNIKKNEGRMAKECSFFAILHYRYMYRDVIKISSCRANSWGFLLVLFFFCFPMKAAGNHIHSNQQNRGPRLLMTALHISESLKQATSRTFSSPEPPGGLSTRTRRLWGHRI